MKIIGIILNVAYTLLILFAVIKADSIKTFPKVLMLGGCVLLVAYMLLLKQFNFYFIEIAGMFCISIATLLNGYYQGNIHITHHLVRALIECGIVVLLLL